MIGVSNMRTVFRAAAVASMLFCPPAAFASESITPCNLLPETNTLDFGSLRLSPCEALAPPAGHWATVAATSYFNDWSGSWHAKTIHQEFHKEHQPFGTDELRLLEQRGPTDHIFQVDAEGWRTDVVLASGFEWGAVLLRMGVFDIGRPSWDAIGETAHRTFHAGLERTLVPRGQTLIYLRTPEHRVELRDEIRGLHATNPSVSVGWTMFRGSSFEDRLVVATQVPIARHNASSLASTGGWDVGVRWLTVGRAADFDLLAGAGYTRVDRHETFYGFPRSNIWHTVAEISHPIGGRFALAAVGRIDSSVIAGRFSGEPAQPDVNAGLAITAALPGNRTATFTFGENVPSIGLGADWSFHLQFGTALPRLR